MKDYGKQTYDLAAVRRFALAGYGEQKYGNEPYSVHLDEVRNELRRFGFTEESHPFLHAAADLHDLFEDHPEITPDQAKEAGIPERAIKIALFVTDIGGGTRQERKEKTYDVLEEHNFGIILKLGDRLANVRRQGKNKMYSMEQSEFARRLRHINPDAEPMWQELDHLLADWTKQQQAQTPLR